MEFIFPFRNNFSCPGLVWKLLTLGKMEWQPSKGSAVFSSGVTDFVVYVQLPPSLLQVRVLQRS